LVRLYVSKEAKEMRQIRIYKIYDGFIYYLIGAPSGRSLLLGLQVLRYLGCLIIFITRWRKVVDHRVLVFLVNFSTQLSLMDFSPTSAVGNLGSLNSLFGL
jgi:hypothetical protein